MVNCFHYVSSMVTTLILGSPWRSSLHYPQRHHELLVHYGFVAFQFIDKIVEVPVVLPGHISFTGLFIDRINDVPVSCSAAVGRSHRQVSY